MTVLGVACLGKQVKIAFFVVFMKRQPEQNAVLQIVRILPNQLVRIVTGFFTDQKAGYFPERHRLWVQDHTRMSWNNMSSLTFAAVAFNACDAAYVPMSFQDILAEALTAGREFCIFW